MLQLVCKEIRRPFSWYYNNDIKEYVRLDDNTGRMQGVISADNLPNPNDIMEARIIAKTKGQLPKDARERADVVTIKLWEHKHANAN